MPAGHRLDMIVHMRSQSLLAVLPIDLFLFTFIHEYMARLTGYALGRYVHFIGDAHIYIKELPWCRKVLLSDATPGSPMPEMPSENPEHWLGQLLAFERSVREGVAGRDLEARGRFDELAAFPTYWGQLGLVLLTMGCVRVGDEESAQTLSRSLNPAYRGLVQNNLRESANRITKS